jgi:hypothetical protein
VTARGDTFAVFAHSILPSAPRAIVEEPKQQNSGVTSSVPVALRTLAKKKHIAKEPAFRVAKSKHDASSKPSRNSHKQSLSRSAQVTSVASGTLSTHSTSDVIQRLIRESLIDVPNVVGKKLREAGIVFPAKQTGSRASQHRDDLVKVEQATADAMDWDE